MRTGSMEGRRDWLLALGLVVVSLAVTTAQPVGPGGGGPLAPSSTLTFSIGAGSLTADPGQYCCSAARAGVYVDVLSCEAGKVTRVGSDAYPSCKVTLAGFSTQGELTRNFNYPTVQAIPGGVPIAGSASFTDVNECDEQYYECSPNAACSNLWGTFRCECLDGYEDESTGRPGSICTSESSGGQIKPGDLEIWQWVLVGVAVFLVLLLILCCCCFYSDCYCYDNEVKRRVIKRVKVIQQPVPVPTPAPCGGCSEDKKIVIQLEQPAPPPAPVPAIQPPIPYGPVPSGPSAFIANSGFDGNVYVAAPTMVQEPVRTVPWAEGGVVLASPPVAEVQTIQVQPQFTLQEPMYEDIPTPKVMYATTPDATVNGTMYFD